MNERLRKGFAKTHPDVLLLDPDDHAAIEAYLVGGNILSKDELPARVETAGAGNMNLTLRVIARNRSVIVKQGRPWVEKYDQIQAPWGRTLVEGQFYDAVSGVPAVSRRMPDLLALDRRNHILVLADLGATGDFTSVYADHLISQADLADLLDWLKSLGEIDLPDLEPDAFANREMRALNYEHIFRLPLADQNGIDLDRITDGLQRVAEGLKADRSYCDSVRSLGAEYLADGAFLVHGDYFPGSWVRSGEGIRIIDPEFCFLGLREFDYGVMLGHLALACADVAAARQVVAAVTDERLDEPKVLGFAGAEIMRRLIGVAQLPVLSDVDAKRRLIEISRSLVLAPEQGLAWW